MIYIQTGLAPDPDLNHARIGYENLAFGLTPTASSAATGHPAIAATYPTTYEFWQPTALPATWAVDLGSAKAVDYLGMVGDMEGCTVALQSSVETPMGEGSWTTQETRTSLTDRINLFLIAPVTARFWRLSISVAIPRLAVIYIGQALAMQRKIYQGHTPLTLSRETELSNNMSEGGQYLGRSIIRKGASTSADWQHLKAAWYRANFDPFVKSAREHPFFIGWRPEQYPAELGFVWTGGDIAPDNSGPRDFMSVGMSFRGLINE
jgi:hypothetical protein